MRFLSLREKMFNPLISGRCRNASWSIDLKTFLVLSAFFVLGEKVFDPLISGRNEKGF